jgi:hypothetical protein
MHSIDSIQHLTNFGRKRQLTFQTEFLDIDIVLPQSKIVLLKNCTFELANMLDGIPCPDNTSDYVHQRLLVVGIPKDKWSSHVQECICICAPES